VELRIAHTADIHLDSRVTIDGEIVRNPDGENIRWRDRQRCFAAFVDDAIRRDCDLAVVAGDLFETARPTPAEYLVANWYLDRLAKVMPVVLIGGNHDDPSGLAERHAVEPILGRRENLYVSTRPELLTIRLMGGQTVLVGTLPSPKKSALLTREEIATLPPEQVNAMISGKLAAVLRGLHGKVPEGEASILVAHVMVIGADFGGADDTATRISIALHPDDLNGWDYVALGDIHKAQGYGFRAWYSGSLDRADFGEEHESKGWNLVTLSGPAHTATVERVPTPARRFLTLSAEDLQDEARMQELFREPVDSVPVLRVKGTITLEAYEAIRPTIALWERLPTFADKLTVTRATRTRNENLTDTLGPKPALSMWAEQNGHQDKLAALFAEHDRIAAAA